MAELARKTGSHARRIQNHLDALEDLFVIHRVEPAADSTGKKAKAPRYFQHRKGSCFDFLISEPKPTFYRLSLAAHTSKREIQKAAAQVQRYPDSRVIFLSATDEPATEIGTRVWSSPIGSIFDPN